MTSVKPRRAAICLGAPKQNRGGFHAVEGGVCGDWRSARGECGVACAGGCAVLAGKSRRSHCPEALCTLPCHQREGESPMGLAPPFRELPKRYPVDHLAEALAEGIVTGHPAMPEFTFTPREIEALLSYLSSLAPERK